MDDLIAAFTQYRLPVVTLHLAIDEVCPIFERINSAGTRLSTYDLMVAATWAEDFDLNEKVSGILAAVEAKGYGSTERSTVWKAVSAIKLDSIQDKSLRQLRELTTADIEALAMRTEAASLAMANMNHHALAVNVIHLQPAQFGPTHACGV